MFRAILNANEHGEPVSVGFPISKSVYADTITKLQQQSMGHAINPDCRVEEVISSVFPVLRQVLLEEKPNRKPAQRLRFGEDEQRNGRDLPLAAGRGIWSL